MSKNWIAFEDGVGVCYVSEEGAEFTRADFERFVKEFAEKHGLKVTPDKALRLFDLCEWQHPYTLLDEDERDHTLWRDGEWPGYAAKRREEELPRFGLTRLYPQAMDHLEREMARHSVVYTIAVEAHTNYGYSRCVETVEMRRALMIDTAQYRCEQLSAAMRRMSVSTRKLQEIIAAYTGASFYIVTFESHFTDERGVMMQAGTFHWNTHDERVDTLYAHHFQAERVAQFFWFLHERLDELAAERNPWPAK